MKKKKIQKFKILIRWIYWIFHDLLWYDHLRSEIIQSVAYDNSHDF
jgi:hypothetical protein